MKIISKHKDYYDYLVGKYGIDPYVVLDRTKSKKQDYPEGKIMLAVCGFLVEGFVERVRRGNDVVSNFYYKEDLLKVRGAKQRKGEKIRIPDRFGRNYDFYCPTIEKEILGLNELHECPVLLIKNTGSYPRTASHTIVEPHPNLSDIKFNRVFEAEEMYNMIYNWMLGQKTKKEVSIAQTDVEKLESKGFDKRISFRH